VRHYNLEFSHASLSSGDYEVKSLIIKDYVQTFTVHVHLKIAEGKNFNCSLCMVLRLCGA
ncbi:MAG: hypothetical protein QXK18_08240, partial [Candidatus Bathyarchaeia archaeon]